MIYLKTCLASLAALAVFTMAVAWSGIYPVGADIPHWQITHYLLQTTRDRSIARAAANIQVPDLSAPDLLLAGGADYNDMCSGCHLKPGQTQSDLSLGLYPAPPNLSRAPAVVDPLSAEARRQARNQFWIIKHGIKASGMPAWGPTHDDQRIWAMVAFLQALPRLSADQYQILTARGDAAPVHEH